MSSDAAASQHPSHRPSARKGRLSRHPIQCAQHSPQPGKASCKNSMALTACVFLPTIISLPERHLELQLSHGRVTNKSDAIADEPVHIYIHIISTSLTLQIQSFCSITFSPILYFALTHPAHYGSHRRPHRAPHSTPRYRPH